MVEDTLEEDTVVVENVIEVTKKRSQRQLLAIPDYDAVQNAENSFENFAVDSKKEVKNTARIDSNTNSVPVAKVKFIFGISYLLHDPEVCPHGVGHPSEETQFRYEANKLFNILFVESFLFGSVNQQGLIRIADLQAVLTLVIVHVRQFFALFVGESALWRGLKVNVVNFVTLVVVP